MRNDKDKDNDNDNDHHHHDDDTTTATKIDSEDNSCEEEEDVVEGIRFVDYVDESQLDYVMSLVGRDLSEPYSIFTYRYFLHRFPHLCILAVPTDSANNNEPIGCVVGKIDYDDQDSNDVSVVNQLQQNLSVMTVATTATTTAKSASSAQTEDSSNQCTTETSVLQHTTGSTSTSTSTGNVVAANNSTRTKQHHINVVSVGYIGMLAVSKEYRRRGIGKALVQRILLRMKNHPGCTSVTLETEVSNVTAQRLYQDIFGFIREELLVRYYLNWNDAYRLRLWFT